MESATVRGLTSHHFAFRKSIEYRHCCLEFIDQDEDQEICNCVH